MAKGTAWLYRLAIGLAMLVLMAVAMTVLALRYWLLPNIENYREDISQAVSTAAKQHVTIGKIAAEWQGMHPYLKLEQVTVHDQAGRPAIELERVDSTLSWLSLPALRPHFRSLELVRPVLDVKRDKRGNISIKGVDVAGGDTEGGFADWLLAQRDIVITNAVITWTDEQRGAPVLPLRNVDFRLVN
ncbi:MAG TPA: AsmA family protein, partial [Burkholderiales bacterium]|nr:AsmA family protein [Burkholderiales bacterium]